MGATVPSCNMRLRLAITCVLCTQLCLLAVGSLPDGSVKYACDRESVSLAWGLTLSPGESLEDVQWFYQGSSVEMIGVLTHGNFLPLPAFAHRVHCLPNWGITIDHVTVQDNGNYSVEITGVTANNIFFQRRRTLRLQVVAELLKAGTRLHMNRNPEAVLDTNTDQWCVELRCGNFTYLGQPPFDVEWTTPSGDRRSSSSYRNGQFKLLVKAEGFEEGSYHCRVPLSASSAFCLASGTSTGNDTVTSLAVDSLDVRLMVLEAQQKVLQKESQELKEENAKLKQQMYTHQPLTRR